MTLAHGPRQSRPGAKTIPVRRVFGASQFPQRSGLLYAVGERSFYFFNIPSLSIPGDSSSLLKGYSVLYSIFSRMKPAGEQAPPNLLRQTSRGNTRAGPPAPATTASVMWEASRVLDSGPPKNSNPKLLWPTRARGWGCPGESLGIARHGRKAN